MKNCNTCAHARPTPPRCVGMATGESLTKITAWLERNESTGAILPGRVVTEAATECPGHLRITSAPPTPPTLRPVILESPYAGDIARNVAYARRAMRDSLSRGETPMVSHLLYTQVLDDHDPEERALGIAAGLTWGRVAEATVVYGDLGISPGMRLGIERAEAEGRPVEWRHVAVDDLPFDTEDYQTWKRTLVRPPPVPEDPAVQVEWAPGPGRGSR